MSASSFTVPVLFEDARCVIVNKPSGLAVHRGYARDPVTVVDLFPALSLVHRLDRATSGCLMLARDGFAAELSAAWPSVRKTYLCITRGDPGSGVLDHAIPKDEGGERVAAVSRYERLAMFERYALVRVEPLTGRFHQVRRHMKHLSCPLIGDTTYGKSEHNRVWASRFGLKRLALHCLSLDEVKAPLPEDLARAMALFGVPL